MPVDLVIDHSVVADVYARPDALQVNTALEYERNAERYRFLRWGQQAFSNFRVVPPGTGICHQVNLEYLSSVVFTDAEGTAYPDTVVGTDSHTPMVNGLGVLAWGVGGIEAEAAMLGQPISMLVPPVVGLRLTGDLPEGTTATDLVLTIAELLRRHGVVGKFVECYGPGVAQRPAREPGDDRQHVARVRLDGHDLPDRRRDAALPAPDRTLRGALRRSSRPTPRSRASGTTRLPSPPTPSGSSSTCRASSRASPGRRAPGPGAPPAGKGDVRRGPAALAARCRRGPRRATTRHGATEARGRAACASRTAREFSLDHGHVVIAAITSCTNTSNPQVMIAAGLLAKKAVELGLSSKPWVKTTLAPGSRVVMDYFERAGLGPLSREARLRSRRASAARRASATRARCSRRSPQAINDHGLACAAVLSGNRNFEGRIHPDVRMNYLASPPLVVAYALAGT